MQKEGGEPLQYPTSLCVPLVAVQHPPRYPPDQSTCPWCIAHTVLPSSQSFVRSLAAGCVPRSAGHTHPLPGHPGLISSQHCAGTTAHLCVWLGGQGCSSSHCPSTGGELLWLKLHTLGVLFRSCLQISIMKCINVRYYSSTVLFHDLAIQADTTCIICHSICTLVCLLHCYPGPALPGPAGQPLHSCQAQVV